MRERTCETIMIVNDNPSFIDIVGDALRAEGLAVLLVPGIPQAIRAVLTGFRPNAVLLDVQESAEIRDLLRVLRHDLALCEVPVILASRRRERLVQIAPGERAHVHAVPADAQELSQLLDRACRLAVSTSDRAYRSSEQPREDGAHP